MFEARPKFRRDTYDKNIFTGKGKEYYATVYPNHPPVQILHYYRGNIVVGQIVGHDPTLVMTYKAYQEGKWLPIEVTHEGERYCGWVDRNQITLTRKK